MSMPLLARSPLQDISTTALTRAERERPKLDGAAPCNLTLSLDCDRDRVRGPFLRERVSSGCV